MTHTERVAFVAYLDIQRRTLLAQVKAIENLIAVIESEANKCYNDPKKVMRPPERLQDRL